MSPTNDVPCNDQTLHNRMRKSLLELSCSVKTSTKKRLMRQWNRKTCLPKALRISIMLSMISDAFAICYGKLEGWSGMLEFAEILLLWQWDSWENDQDISFFKKCKQVFGNFENAAYFVSFGEITGSIRMEDRNSLLDKYNMWSFRNTRLRLPVFIALFLNLLLIWSMFVCVDSCVRSCPPWDIKCYSLILVPRIAMFFIVFAFMVYYQKKYLKKHWNTRHEFENRPKELVFINLK